MNLQFNEDQLDALREFMNVSIGAATASMANLLNAFGTMHIPKIEVCNSDELAVKIQESIDIRSMYFVTKQLFTGKFGGECMFVISEDSSINLGRHLYSIENPSFDDINDAVIELTNILTSTIVSRLTQELNTQVQFFVPSLQFLDPSSIVDEEDVAEYSKIIIISTILDFQDQQIIGNIYILTKDEAIESLKVLIDKKIEEIYG
ncbi:CheC, inhibitor of MCP methylation [Sulfurimonas denitrificans DSM 1251]|uniref:CheC, inhibitor of MCP methylation n=1 Tax=Sulfurimonas denitrificans (strain ATCC 33889 / DSM 1251) TaxID=326298 RepID=Q30RR8_SULDN|nr:chemotaxis protein CheC [Sulfurimonas denitrificans]ABB44313.1 CheC, inhibitor of MCP methylation [Sulfurimonas denitrificans DSM 1251]